MLENPKGFLLSVFFGIVGFFPENKKKFFSSIFSCFATEWMLKNLKGSPLSVFRHCETLARQGLALASPGAPLGPFFEYVIFSKKNFSKNFRFSTTVKEYLTLGSLFAIFEPWIWRRLGPVPACLNLLFISSFVSQSFVEDHHQRSTRLANSSQSRPLTRTNTSDTLKQSDPESSAFRHCSQRSNSHSSSVGESTLAKQDPLSNALKDRRQQVRTILLNFTFAESVFQSTQKPTVSMIQIEKKCS